MPSQNKKLQLTNQNEQKTSEILINFVQKIDKKEKKFAQEFTNGYLHKIVITDILTWVNKNQPDCLQMICDFIQKSDISLKINDEQSRVNQLVEELIQKSKENNNFLHLQDIKNKIIQHPRSAFILNNYRQIISETITDDSSEDINYLIEIGLIIQDERGVYQVSNRLYEQVFDQEWIENTFKSDRPYNDKFKAWKESYHEGEFSDEEIPHFISAEELDNALEWITGLQIPREEEIYLIRSRVFK